MKDFFSLIGKVIMWIAIIALAFAGPVFWFLADVEIFKKILGLFGI